MLRPAIIGHIKKYPHERHILHIMDCVAGIFEDIEGLEIVPLHGSSSNIRINYSEQKIRQYKNPIVFKLSDCDARYEMDHIDNLIKSRQEIYCDVVGVKFSKNNYNIKFTNEETQRALDFIDGRDCIGVHLKGAEKWRDYLYVNIKKGQLKMWNVVDRLAKKYDRYVVTFDNHLQYKGSRKNVLSFISNNVRDTLAVMSLCKAGIGPDSFGVHGFGACGVPVYGMFGPTNPAVRLKYYNAFWCPRGDCEYQYCWYKYTQCKNGIGCLNARTSKFYVDDFFEKLGFYYEVA